MRTLKEIHRTFVHLLGTVWETYTFYFYVIAVTLLLFTSCSKSRYGVKDIDIEDNRIEIVERKVIGGQFLYIIKVDGWEYLVYTGGGIQPLPELYD